MIRQGTLRARLLVGLALTASAVLVAAYLLLREEPAPAAYEHAEFHDLPGWQDGDPRPALIAFQKSCRKLLARGPEASVRPQRIGGRVRDWTPVCKDALALESPSPAETRAFFESAFTPVVLRDHGETEGLFTGYYEPEIAAARERTAAYTIPIYRRPADLVSVDLGDFRSDLQGRRIAGRVEDGRLRPYATRTAIEAGELAGRGLELAWAADPVAVFFLQIQGSGRLRLSDGEVLRVGFAGRNGHAYTSLGKLMAERGLLEPDEISSPAIAEWLRAHPERGSALMRENAAYVFFRVLEKEGPVGAQGVALTPGRSLAVDRRHIPLGAPVWLAARHPDPEAPETNSLPLRRLMIAQDTGSAIAGAVRGDVFWGAGEMAAKIAGHMAHRGRYWLLLPGPLAEGLVEGEEPVS